MFLFAWYRGLYSSIVNFFSKRKHSKRDEIITNQRRISLQKVKHLKSFTYWPVAKMKVNTQFSTQIDTLININLPAKTNDLRYVKRINKRLPKLPLFVKPINFNRQEIPSKII